MGEQTNIVGLSIAADDRIYLEELASRGDRTLDDVLGEAVGRYVRWRRAFDAAIEEGLDDVHAGRVVTDEELGHHLAEMRQRFLARRA